MLRKGRGGGKRRRLADLVLCDENLPEIIPYNWYHQDKPSRLQGTYTKAILTIECKNNNLDYRWGYPSHVKAFDDDIMSRFLWGDIANILGSDFVWERYAGWQNLFPRAVKILLTPKFVWLDKAKPTPKADSALVDWWRRANDLLGANKDLRLVADAAWRLENDLMPPSFSVRDQIEWRIRRLKLQVIELGCQPMPNRKTPPEAKRRLAYQLKPYLEPLIPSIKGQISTKVIEVSNVKSSNGHTKVSKAPLRRKKFGSPVSEKRSRYLSKLGYEPPYPKP
jgi:hypothetical protein